MLDKVKELIGEVASFQTSNVSEIEAFRIKFLGKKGIVTDLFSEFKNVAEEERKEFGHYINTLKNAAQEKVNLLKEIIENTKTIESKYGDLTRPAEPIILGN